MKRLFVLLMAVALLTACAPASPELTPAPGPEVGRPAPDFGYGEESLIDLRGKVVLLVFWSPHCSACHRQISVLQETHEQYEDEGLVVIAISKMAGQAEGTQTTFTTLIDGEGGLHTRYWIKAYPTLFFIDKEGTIRVRHEGYMRRSEVVEFIEGLLLEP